MKKIIFAIVAVVMSTVFAFGCTSTASLAFCSLSKLNGPLYEKTEYSFTLKDESVSGEDKTISKPESFMSISLEEYEGSTELAVLKTRTELIYNDKKEGYNDLKDIISSEVVFYAYSDSAEFPLKPKSVKKSFSRGHENDKNDNYSYTFDYDTGAGVFTNADGTEIAFTIKEKNLKNVYDNEQFIYLLSTSVFNYKVNEVREFAAFRVLSIYDYVKNSTSIPSFAIAGIEEKAVYNTIKTETGANLLFFTAGIPAGTNAFKGSQINAVYSMTDTVKIEEQNIQVGKYKLLGYEQDMRNSLGEKLQSLSFFFKSYSNVKG